MIQEYEDDRLDQSLRDTFSDFDLPPSGHVWSGVEGRLSAQPGPPRQVPLLLLLPAVALVAGAVGWLLPHPATAPAVPPAASTTQASTKPLPQPPSTTSALAATSAAPAGTPVFGAAPPVTVRQPARPAVGASRGQANHYQNSPLAQAARPTPPPTDRLEVTTQPLHALNLVAARKTAPEAVPATLQLPVAAATPGNLPQQDTAGASTSAPYAAAQPSKAEPRQEWRPEYRTPKHRLAERGLRLQRLRNNITKQWQRLFKPQRTVRATQPGS